MICVYRKMHTPYQSDFLGMVEGFQEIQEANRLIKMKQSEWGGEVWILRLVGEICL